MNYYATITDHNYAVRVLCLYRSLEPWLEGKIFGIYCIDPEAAALFRRLSLRNAWVFGPEEFETAALRQVRAGRAVNEYCWTCKPAVLLHGLDREPSFDWAVYLDSDMMAFGDPDRGLPAAADAHVLITPHRPSSPAFVRDVGVGGVYNGGLVAIRGSAEGRRALAWWGDRCLEKCPRIPDGDAYADQKYLERLPVLFTGVVSCGHKGMNAAPWNIGAYAVSLSGDRVRLDEDDLLIYHFQGLQIFGEHLYDIYPGAIRIAGPVRRHIYRPHLKALRHAWRMFKARGLPCGRPARPMTPKLALNKLKRLALGLNNLVLA